MIVPGLLVTLLLFPAPGGAPTLDERELIREPEIDLRSGDKWVRQGAVEVLAELDIPAAWELVVEALADPTGEVADTAQLRLGTLARPELLSLVAGREGLGARDTWVRLRVAEALGRVPIEAATGLLTCALGDDDAGVRRAAAWSIERRARADLLGEARTELASALTRRLARERDVLARARMLFALGATAPEAARGLLRDAAARRDTPSRCVAAALAPTLIEAPQASRFLAPLAGDPSLTVRTQVVDSLAALGCRDAAVALAGRLAEETEERLSARIVDHLQALSGMRFRRDPRPWRDWADRLPADWREERSAPREEHPPPETRTVFAGLPILSHRVAFLIDLSGSIWKERADGRTKKEIVDGKLREVLERLPRNARFNLIPFTGEPHPWRDELAEATPKNVRAAIRFFERCHHQGTGNFWDAAMLAIEDPAVDTLVVLTDGVPTGGRRYELELIVPLFLERNAMRKVVLDSILVDAPVRMRRHWTALSEGTGGLSLAIEL